MLRSEQGDTTKPPNISTSKFLLGLQCSKLLGHAYNAKHLIPESDAATPAISDQGHETGALAKRLRQPKTELASPQS
jgi:hypothetical protein